MSRARELSRLGNPNIIQADSEFNVGFGTLTPRAKGDFVGVVSATSFYGDGSTLSNISSAGIGTALSDTKTSPLNSLFYTNQALTIGVSTTIDPPTSGSLGYSQASEIEVSDGVDLVTGTWTDVSSGSASASGSGKYVSVVGTDLSNRGAAYMPCTVVVGKKYEFGFRCVAGITNSKIGVDSNDGTSDVRDAVGNNPDLAYINSADSTVVAGRKYRDAFTATTTTADIYFQGVNGTVTADEIFLRLVDNSAAWTNNPIPSVGVDEGVTFSGDTKINSPNYMYFPTGDTSQRGRGRALIAGGTNGGGWGTKQNAISYIQIQSGGIAKDFGDLSSLRSNVTSVSSSTRAVFGGTETGGVVEKLEFASKGNSTDFGTLAATMNMSAGMCSPTRGVWAGATSPSPLYNYDAICKSAVRRRCY